MKPCRSNALKSCKLNPTSAPKTEGYANGFKPKTVDTRIGELCFAVPQVRGEVDFYPSALEKGLRSERALNLAIAEMYVQGVSTRKVTKVLQELCGLDITSTQVSRASAQLDQEMENWRSRPLGQMKALILHARYEKVRLMAQSAPARFSSPSASPQKANAPS